MACHAVRATFSSPPAPAGPNRPVCLVGEADLALPELHLRFSRRVIQAVLLRQGEEAFPRVVLPGELDQGRKHVVVAVFPVPLGNPDQEVVDVRTAPLCSQVECREPG